MCRPALSVAGGVAAGVAVASVLDDLKPRTTVLAVGATVGGLAGFFAWKWISNTKGPVDCAIAAIDAAHKKQKQRFEASVASRDVSLGPGQQDALSEHEYCLEVEKWVIRLRGGEEALSPALRVAVRAQNFQGQRLRELLRRQGIEKNIADRACRLVAKDLPLKTDPDMQTLEDATCLVFLQRELESLQQGKDEAKLIDIIGKTWKKMSPEAQALAIEFDYSPGVLGFLLEAITAAEGLEASKPPMVAPRLPFVTVKALRDSWAHVPQDVFGSAFLDRLFAEDPEMRQVMGFVTNNPKHMAKAIQTLLDLLDPLLVPRLERVAHGLVALPLRFGQLRMKHVAALKRAMVRTVTAHAPPKEKKLTNRAWEAFFYALAAVAAPHLVLADPISQLASATAASLPVPGAGTHAGAVAAQGAGLLEMCLSISALSVGGTSAPESVLGRLQEARCWLVDSVRDDVNAYCGLLASVYARPDDTRDAEITGGIDADEAERRRWMRRATEVPLRVAEVSMGLAIACLPCKKQIKRSLQGDWIAGAKLLRTATEISTKNVQINLRDMKAAMDIAARFQRLQDTEPPWEDLCDL